MINDQESEKLKGFQGDPMLQKSTLNISKMKSFNPDEVFTPTLLTSRKSENINNYSSAGNKKFDEPVGVNHNIRSIDDDYNAGDDDDQSRIYN